MDHGIDSVKQFSKWLVSNKGISLMLFPLLFSHATSTGSKG